jgi:PAS domain S-box-containing protein
MTAETAADGRSPAGRDQHRRVVVLNVDDYEAGRYATSRVLRQAGFDVLEAATGNEALQATRREHPDLVLLDVNLPDVDGFEVCRRIKSDPETSTIPVLYLSAAYRTSEHRVQGLDLGADGYLTQPVEPRELVATVNAMLRAREVEEAVRENEERFRALVAGTAQIVWTTPPDGEFDRAQPGWTAFTGQPLDALRGTGWLDAVHPEDRERVRQAWERALAARSRYAVEYRLRRHDGEYRYMAATAVPVPDRAGGVREWVGTHVDLTDRRRAEEWQRLLGEAGAALASSLDPESSLGAVARAMVADTLAAWCAVDLLEEDGGLRRVASEAHLPAGPELAAALDALLPPESDAGPGRVARSGRADLVVDAPSADRLPAAEMRRLGVRSYACVPLVARGQTVGALTAVATDTQPRLTGRDLAMLKELAGRVALALDNARLFRDAVKANAVKSEFLAVMSHELRTPLNAIIGYADLLDAGVAGDLNTRQRDQLGRIRTGSKHLLRLIEEVLLFSRLEAGREEVVWERVDLAALVHEAAVLVEPLAREKRLEFRVDAPAEMPAVTDSVKVHQIVLNLLSNAVKFSDKGEVAVELTAAGGVARIEVRDTGIGIAEENLELIFDAFSQVEQAPTRRVGGTGLGLSVTRNLARLMGGDVTVESRIGGGSIFAVLLPLEPPGAPS